MVCMQDLSLISVAMCPTQDLWTSIHQLKKKKKKDESAVCDDCHCPDSQVTTPPMKRHEKTTKSVITLLTSNWKEQFKSFYKIKNFHNQKRNKNYNLIRENKLLKKKPKMGKSLGNLYHSWHVGQGPDTIGFRPREGGVRDNNGKLHTYLPLTL